MLLVFAGATGYVSPAFYPGKGEHHRVVPTFNFDVQQSMRTIDEMKAFAAKSGAQLWINHDMEQHAKIPKAPASVQ